MVEIAQQEVAGGIIPETSVLYQLLAKQRSTQPEREQE